MTPSPPTFKLPVREKLAYGCGDFASCLYWRTFMVYLPFFYTDIFGITAAALATMLLVSRIWDGINDPIIGMFADRTETRWGKFRPYILFGAVPFAIFGVLTFTTPNLGPMGKLVWAYLTYNGLMMLYTTVNIPYTSMLGVMTTTASDRTQLASVKFMFAFAANLVVSATLLPIVDALGGGSAQRGWQLAFVVYGLVAIGFFMLTVFGTRERIKPLPDANTSARRDLKLILTNKAWLLLTATTLVWILHLGIHASVSAHYFKYFIFDGNPDTPLPFLGRSFTMTTLLSAFNTFSQVGAVAGVLLTSTLSTRFAKRPLFIGGFVLAIVSAGGFYFLQPGQLLAIFVAEALFALFGAALPVLLWAMYADTADYGEWKTGRRTTGLVFSASTMSQKVGWALAAFVAFQALALVGFTADMAPTPEVKNNLVLMMSLVPVGFGILALVIFHFYPLTDQRVNEMNAELKQRRIAAGLPAEV